MEVPVTIHGLARDRVDEWTSNTDRDAAALRLFLEDGHQVHLRLHLYPHLHLHLHLYLHLHLHLHLQEGGCGVLYRGCVRG